MMSVGGNSGTALVAEARGQTQVRKVRAEVPVFWTLNRTTRNMTGHGNSWFPAAC